MKGLRYNVMRNELSKSIDQLPPGAEVFLTFFSGPAWVAGEDPKEVRQHWEKSGNTVKLKKNAPRPKIKWTRIAKSSKNKLLDHIKDTPMSYGTDWANPFRLVFDLQPKPDVVYFMTDGSPQAKNEQEVIKMVKEWNAKTGRKIPINAIAIGDPRIAKNMEGLAKDSNKGQFTVVDTSKYKFTMGFKRDDGGPANKNKNKGNKNKKKKT
ncbi:MAG: vWA domain-containing protein, partial [Verrucomicrobiota bacterium]